MWRLCVKNLKGFEKIWTSTFPPSSPTSPLACSVHVGAWLVGYCWIIPGSGGAGAVEEGQPRACLDGSCASGGDTRYLRWPDPHEMWWSVWVGSGPCPVVLVPPSCSVHQGGWAPRPLWSRGTGVWASITVFCPHVWFNWLAFPASTQLDCLMHESWTFLNSWLKKRTGHNGYNPSIISATDDTTPFKVCGDWLMQLCCANPALF